MMCECMEYDMVKLIDGTVGFLIEDFNDGWRLFGSAAPGSPSPFDQREVKREEIARFVQPDESVNPYEGR